MGVVPPAGAISWLATCSRAASQDNAAVASLEQAQVMVPSTGLVWSTMSTPSVAPVSSGGFPGVPSIPVVPAGSYMGEGLLPIPERLTKKILLQLEFVEMRELMPETWLRDEEESTRNTLSLPRRRTAPVTDILQWLQCFAGMVGVLSQKYPHMVPELMAYQATIVKCSRDFEGLAWAQYDRAYRRQAAQTKDLRWSRLNPTLFSLCFAGKARRNIACAHCLSDNHTSDACPDNPSRSFFWWQHPGATFPHAGGASPVGVAPPVGGAHPGRLRICHLFNARDGPKCTYSPCKFAHVCSACKANHPRSACPKVQGTQADTSGRGGVPISKRLRLSE